MSAPDDTVKPVLQGAQTYQQLLSGAGGNLLEALVRQRDRSALVVALYDAPPYDLLVPSLPVARLSINLLPGVVSGGVAGERGRRYESPRHSMYLTPAQAAVHWRKDQASRHLNVYFHADAFVAEGAPDAAGTPLFNATLPGTRPLVDELAAELTRADPLADEAVDSLARLLLARLVRHAERRNPLTPQALERVRAFAWAHLSERLLVKDLAQVAGLSPGRYAQAHLQLTGKPPHRFLLELRLERARELLLNTELGLADVALACGFSSQQHLTSTMRRRLGATPGQFRLTRRSKPPRHA
jgi:AraC family transcriptional regulator